MNCSTLTGQVLDRLNFGPRLFCKSASHSIPGSLAADDFPMSNDQACFIWPGFQSKSSSRARWSELSEQSQGRTDPVCLPRFKLATLSNSHLPSHDCSRPNRATTRSKSQTDKRSRACSRSYSVPVSAVLETGSARGVGYGSLDQPCYKLSAVVDESLSRVVTATDSKHNLLFLFFPFFNSGAAGYGRGAVRTLFRRRIPSFGSWRPSVDISTRVRHRSVRLSVVRLARYRCETSQFAIRNRCRPHYRLVSLPAI